MLFKEKISSFLTAYRSALEYSYPPMRHVCFNTGASSRKSSSMLTDQRPGLSAPIEETSSRSPRRSFIQIWSARPLTS